jgi:hypothetical protein
MLLHHSPFAEPGIECLMLHWLWLLARLAVCFRCCNVAVGTTDSDLLLIYHFHVTLDSNVRQKKPALLLWCFGGASTAVPMPSC